MIARLQPEVSLRLDSCDRTWCAVRVATSEYHGYVRQADLWGVYPDELIQEDSVWGSFKSLL